MFCMILSGFPLILSLFCSVSDGKSCCSVRIQEIKKIVIKIILGWCLNRYYSMILSRCYYKSSTCPPLTNISNGRFSYSYDDIEKVKIQLKFWDLLVLCKKAKLSGKVHRRLLICRGRVFLGSVISSSFCMNLTLRYHQIFENWKSVSRFVDKINLYVFEAK